MSSSHRSGNTPQPRGRVRFLSKRINAIKAPQGQAASIVRLVTGRDQQQPQPARPQPPVRPPRPEGSENWLDGNLRHVPERPHTTIIREGSSALLTPPLTPPLTGYLTPPLSPRWHGDGSHTSQAPITSEEPFIGKKDISPPNLGPSLSALSLLSSPVMSAPAETSLPHPPPETIVDGLHNLRDTVKSSREAETLHSYDVGIIAALHSMATYWTYRGEAIQDSSAEKDIYFREAERLKDLISDADNRVLLSQAWLIRKQEEEEEAWDHVFATNEGQGVSSVSETGFDYVPAAPTPQGAVGLGIYYPHETEHGGMQAVSSGEWDMRIVTSDFGTWYYHANSAPGLHGRGTPPSAEEWARIRGAFSGIHEYRQSADDGLYGASGLMNDAEIINNEDSNVAGWI